MKIITTLTFLLTAFVAMSQIQRDQDLVTLKNGYQILGYVIEQEPGKLIRVYRPDENDTVVAQMTEISKLTKIWVQTFSGKTMDDAPSPDTIEFGRFNNKRNIFSVNYTWLQRDIETRSRRGLGLAYYRSFNNIYWGGFSANIFSRQDPNPNYADLDESTRNHEFSQVQFLFENKVRLSLRPQNKRLTTLLGFNVGYVFDGTESDFKSTENPLDVEFEDYRDGFMLQTALALRVNPDNNSGFMIEPGYTLFPQNVMQYADVMNNEPQVYLGYRRQVNHLFTLKIAYFF